MREPGEFGPCRECPAQVLWVLTEAGKRMPLDPHPIERAHPSRKGMFVLSDDRTRVRSARDEDLGEPLYLSHFATCPKRDAFRTRKAGRP